MNQPQGNEIRLGDGPAELQGGVSSAVRQRLDFEKALLSKYLPQFRWDQNEQGFYAEGWIETSSGRRYRLRVQMDPVKGHHRLYVLHPRRLPTHDGRGSLDRSRAWHETRMVSVGSDGTIEIDWAAHKDAETCLRAVIGGAAWCEAYEAYLRTGRPIHCWF
jgi:hypothetical protein